jgi:hypothetical protein
LIFCLICFTIPVSHSLYHSKKSTQGDTTTQDWSSHHDLSVVDYKALTGLSLLRIPHFCARRGASLKDLNPDTTSASKANCFPVGRQNMKKHTNIGKVLELRGSRVIYLVRQMTHRAITTNKRGQVIVIMHASEIKTKQEHNI